MAYTNISNIQAFLGRNLTSSENQIVNLILASADAFINNQIGGSFGAGTTTTKYYDGGSTILTIDSCVSITAVSLVDDAENIVETYLDGEDYEARPRNETLKSWIQSRVGCFPKGVANIAVSATFTRGLTVPDDIVYLATYLCGKLFQSNESGGLKAESIEGYSRTFGEFKQNDDTISMLLSPYIQNDILI